MAKTLICPFCGQSFSWVGPIGYWDEYVCKCGASLWVRIIQSLEVNYEV